MGKKPSLRSMGPYSQLAFVMAVVSLFLALVPLLPGDSELLRLIALGQVAILLVAILLLLKIKKNK